MPSWNIHTALVEQLLSQKTAPELGITDTNTFLFGNLVPDIYVGYMVSDVSHTLRYVDTHFADATHIPVPREHEFWQTYVLPYQHAGGASDLALGVWMHLLADCMYNQRVRAFNAEHAIPNGEQTRIKKQHDFDLFGQYLHPATTVMLTPHVSAEAERFDQYAIDEPDIEAAIRADKAYLARAAQASLKPEYQLLNQAFLQDAFDEIVRVAAHRLAEYQAHVTHTEEAPKLQRPAYPVGPEPAILLADDPQAAAAINTKDV